MFAAVPMFLAGASDRLADLALNCLAVAGGYLAGHVLGALVAWGLDRWVFAQKAPDFVKKLVSIVCGIALAILVALVVFGKGGGTGGGSGEGQGKGAGDPGANPGKADPKADDVRPPVKVDIPKGPPPPPDTPRVTVTFLAGDATQPGRYYYVGDERVPKSFDEVKEAVAAKQREAAGKAVVLVALFPADPARAADDDSRTVRQVIEWARGAGVEVVLGGRPR